MGRTTTIVLLLAAALLPAGCTETFDDAAYARYAREAGAFAGGALPPGDPSAATAPAEPSLGAESALADYLAYAALHSPRLQAAFADWQAATERTPQMTALPDPRFAYKHYISEVMMRDGNMRQMFELSQEFPWPGKLALRGRIATEEARAAFHRFEAARLKLFYDVRWAYGEYYYLARATHITEQNIELLNQIEAISRRRYAVGADAHPDVIRAQVEQGILADRLRSLQKLRPPAVARLNALLNRPAAAELPWPTDVPADPCDPPDEQIRVWAAEVNPEVRALDRQIAARQHGIDLARKDYFPDVMLGFEYGRMVTDSEVPRSPTNPYAVMVGLNLPIWWDKLAAGVREARWRHLQAVGEKDALLNRLSADVEMALFEFQDAQRKIDLYRDTLVPKAQQALLAAQTAYSAGKTGFQDYLDAQRVLLEFQLSYERSRTDRAQRRAELEMLVGKALPASP